MKTLKTTEELKKLREKLGSQSLAFVPTMGALHEGHLSLVKEAKELADVVIVSIFVNPLQFGPNEDFNKYPRLIDEDTKKLKALNVDYLFCPELQEEDPWFLLLHEYKNQVKANPDIANKLCGLNRPGHFDGVCAVVKLFLDLIKPHYAIFGEKDYQQLTVIKDMANSHSIQTKIIAHPIIREENGLAMSSRNQYLSPEEKELACNLYQELQTIKNKITKESNSKDINNLLENSKTKLESLGFDLDYLEIHWDRIFVAAKLGKTRLIDNLAIN